MKLNEYKDSVGSLRLSDEFKRELKQKMLEEAENLEASEPKIKMSVGEASRKYLKYAAPAACLLLVASTIGVLNATKGAIKMSEDIAAQPEAAALYDKDDGCYDDMIESDAESDGYESNSFALAESPEADSVEEDTPVDDYAAEVIEDSAPIPNPALQDDAETVPEVNPVSGNGYSPDASPDYDGSYHGEDYIVNDIVGSAHFNAKVVSEMNITAKSIEFEDVAGMGGPETTVETVETDNEEESLAEEIDFKALTSGDSMKYYDIRDGVLAKLENIGLIRFKIVDAYETVNAIASNAPGFKMDPDCQTLYKINVSYDYFNSEDTDSNRLLINTGNSEYQLIGRPAMEGEYIAVVTENSDGILVPIQQLIYAVHKINGLDVAYHLYSDDGFMVDPGSTNMGLMSEEFMVTNSTANNPEIYTQKASVRELTYYLKRNILRMEPNVLDFSSKRQDSSSEEGQTEDTSTAEAPREAIRANFPTGKLKITISDEPSEVGSYSSDSIDSLMVNGIGVGAEMSEALKAFYLSNYSFTPDAHISLCSSDEDGGWYVIVTFSDNIVTKIEVFE